MRQWTDKRSSRLISKQQPPYLLISPLHNSKQPFPQLVRPRSAWGDIELEVQEFPNLGFPSCKMAVVQKCGKPDSGEKPGQLQARIPHSLQRRLEQFSNQRAGRSAWFRESSACRPRRWGVVAALSRHRAKFRTLGNQTRIANLVD
jgi:hypothetical protein